MRRVSIFGSTGSIGVNTVDLLTRQGGPDHYRTIALTGGRNVARLAEQARALRAEVAVTCYPECLDNLKDALAGSGTETLAGPEALVAVAERETDWAMSAIVGAAGLPPTMALAKSTKVLALANKESLVCAGAVLKAACRASGTTLLPVDSEHSAIFQCLEGSRGRLERILLTASGGPFRTWDVNRIASATVAEALNHPNWSMGERITIDSASLFNKALEMIEAHQLFDVPAERIEVVVHPQSIVHSAVMFADGAVLAQMGPPDMRGPIGYALNYPDRAPLPVERLDFAAIGTLTFEAPDRAKFPSITLAERVMEMGGAAGAVFNAAKESALDAFLEGSIKFPQMADTVATVLDELGEEAACVSAEDGIDPILMLDARSRDRAKHHLKSLTGAID